MQGIQLSNRVLETGLISPDQLRVAQTQCRKTGIELIDALLSCGFITHAELRDLQGEAIGRSTIELASVIPDSQALALVPRSIACQYCLLPLVLDQSTLSLKLAMPFTHDLVALDAIRAVLPPSISLEVVLASSVEILNAIDRHYGVKLSIDGILQELELHESPEQSVGSGTPESAQPVVRLVDALLVDAVRHNASDLHFEAEMNFLRIRYRIDGVLHQIRILHIDHWSAMLVRIKVLCGMNIAETRAPQDGRITLSIDGRNVDFRVSSFPACHGECVVLRLLDHKGSVVSLDELGLVSDVLHDLQRLIRKPQGLILVTGPTGSGKSTTLYSILNEISADSINIVTMEDPVEYRVPQVRQCSVNSALKLDFASGVRCILRQDPDVILVGETRDSPTCEMVARATLTGHLVLTTLHSGSALGALARLQELGLNLGHLATNILALIAQRLIRKLCEHCKVPELPDNGDRLYVPVGCLRCNGIGYQGRVAIVELYTPTQAFNTMLAQGASVGELMLQATTEGHIELVEAGLAQVRNGVTSLSELQRVTGFELQ